MKLMLFNVVQILFNNAIDELFKKKNSVAIMIYTGKVDVYYLSINHRSFFYPRIKKRTVDNISVIRLIS